MGGADRIGVIVRLAKVLEITLSEVGLTMNQYRLLTLVQERSPSAAELSVRLAMKPPNVSVLTRGMVERGLISQARQSGDGRRRTLALTADGRALVRRANKRCAATLQYLEAASPTSTPPGGLVASLDWWLPVLDAEADRARRNAETSDQNDATSPGVASVRLPSSGRGRSTRRG
jgi:DNA-binding MarR family transcriptional regulator